MSQWGSDSQQTPQLQLYEPGSEHGHGSIGAGANGHKSHPIFDTIKSGYVNENRFHPAAHVSAFEGFVQSCWNLITNVLA